MRDGEQSKPSSRGRGISGGYPSLSRQHLVDLRTIMQLVVRGAVKSGDTDKLHELWADLIEEIVVHVDDLHCHIAALEEQLHAKK